MKALRRALLPCIPLTLYNEVVVLSLITLAGVIVRNCKLTITMTRVIGFCIFFFGDVAMKATNLKRAVLPFMPLIPYVEAVVFEPR